MSESRVYQEDSPEGAWCVEFRGQKCARTFPSRDGADELLRTLMELNAPDGKYTWMMDALDKALQHGVHTWVYVQNDRWQVDLEVNGDPPIATQNHPEAVHVLCAGYPKDWVWKDDRRKENPGLHMLYVKTACRHLAIFDEMIQTLHDQSNLNMLDATVAMNEERARLVFENRAYFDADEIMRGMKAGRYQERDE